MKLCIDKIGLKMRKGGKNKCNKFDLKKMKIEVIDEVGKRIMRLNSENC